MIEKKSTTSNILFKEVFMAISEERFSESAQMIREHLVTLHGDGDENSLFVRMGEILTAYKDRGMVVDSWAICANIILDRSNENEGSEF